MLAVSVPEILTIVLYLLVVGYLGFLGFRRTKNASDYLLAGRKVHPFVMAMSYGATFISTSAIVGFGGVAGMFGMSLLWLTFLNIFVGIFIAFVFLGGRTRHMGHRLDAHTFPELLGRRYQSKFVQVFAGSIVFLFMPIYAAAVLIGGCAFIASQFGLSYNVALLIFSVLIAAYVVVGGLKGVMYTDALQGTIMFAGMLVLLVASYLAVGGVVEGHSKLAELGKAPSLFGPIGFKGWTQMPEFGWGGPQYDLWWIIVSTIVLGVGIGVLAQPQLAVRFMTVKSKRELNRAVLVGGIFILIMTGVAFTVGSLSNVFFLNEEVVKGTLISETPKGAVIVKRERDVNPGAPNPDVKAVPCSLLHIDTTGDGAADTHLIKSTFVEKLAPVLPQAEIEPADYAVGRPVKVKPHATAYLRAIVRNEDGTYECKTSRVIPIYLRTAMPRWFGLVFLLTLLAAAMSTLSSQFHAVGTSIGRDVYEQVTRRPGASIGITRIGIIVGILIAVVISYLNPGEGFIIARATAIFFGLCASAFLPAFVGGLFSRRVTKAAAIASMIVGFVVTAVWLLFVKTAEASALGLVQKVTGGKTSILAGQGNWAAADPLVVALPLSALVFVLVCLFTRKPDEAHLHRCFRDQTGQKGPEGPIGKTTRPQAAEQGANRT